MYKIIGADQKEYGPVTGEQLRQWLSEGRVNAATRVQPEGSAVWKPISELPEFATLFPSVAATPPPLTAMPAAPVVPGNNGFAIWSLVLGIVSIIPCCNFVTGVVAIVLGIVGLSQLKTRPHQKGQGLAIAGIILGIIGIVIGVVASIVMFNSGFMQNLQNQMHQ